LSIDFFASLKTIWQTELKYTLDFDALKTFLGIAFTNLPTHSFSINGSPSETLNFRINYDLGKDLSANEIVPEVGRLRSSFLTLNFQLNDNFNINPSLRYSRLEHLNGGEDYFNGSIARLNSTINLTAHLTCVWLQKKTALQTNFIYSFGSMEP